jgi:hypothetical protein
MERDTENLYNSYFDFIPEKEIRVPIERYKSKIYLGLSSFFGFLSLFLCIIPAIYSACHLSLIISLECLGVGYVLLSIFFIILRQVASSRGMKYYQAQILSICGMICLIYNASSTLAVTVSFFFFANEQNCTSNVLFIGSTISILFVISTSLLMSVAVTFFASSMSFGERVLRMN